jgi:hypothetical protein
MKNKLKTSIALMMTLVILVCCESVNEDLFLRHFTIQKGEHYSTPRLVEFLQRDHLSFTAQFDESAAYDFGDAALQSNKNKLLGFSDCNSQHHENSARFAWQWFNGKLEIYAYCYVNGIRIENYVGTVRVNEINLFEIRIVGNAYVFYLNGEESAKVERGNSCRKGTYYLLWPYFGGSIPAPHDVSIAISIKTD